MVLHDDRQLTKTGKDENVCGEFLCLTWNPHHPSSEVVRLPTPSMPLKPIAQGDIEHRVQGR
ncbi:hypothetical protein Plhal710r2_c082g0180701 [Plasmopara halstedii]